MTMTLFYSPTSPFARKALAAAHERGLADKVAIEMVTPAGHDGLVGANPLEKVPALVLADGTAVYDSIVIVSHFDGMGSGPRLIPDDQAERTRILRRHALADGIMEAGVASVMEGRRPEERIWSDFIARQKGKIMRAVDTLEGETADMGDVVDVANLSVICALEYVVFRLGDMGWRDDHLALAAWVQSFGQRPSLAVTRPQNTPA